MAATLNSELAAKQQIINLKERTIKSLKLRLWLLRQNSQIGAFLACKTSQWLLDIIQKAGLAGSPGRQPSEQTSVQSLCDKPAEAMQLPQEPQVEEPRERSFRAVMPSLKNISMRSIPRAEGPRDAGGQGGVCRLLRQKVRKLVEDNDRQMKALRQGQAQGGAAPFAQTQFLSNNEGWLFRKSQTLNEGSPSLSLTLDFRKAVSQTPQLLPLGCEAERAFGAQCKKLGELLAYISRAVRKNRENVARGEREAAAAVRRGLSQLAK